MYKIDPTSKTGQIIDIENSIITFTNFDQNNLRLHSLL